MIAVDEKKRIESGATVASFYVNSAKEILVRVTHMPITEFSMQAPLRHVVGDGPMAKTLTLEIEDWLGHTIEQRVVRELATVVELAALLQECDMCFVSFMLNHSALACD